MAKKEPQKTRMKSRSQKAKAPLSGSLKTDLDTKAKKLVEDVLKPKYVKPPPKDARFNYITDVWIKWIGNTLYFGATYACPGTTAKVEFHRYSTRTEVHSSTCQIRGYEAPDVASVLEMVQCFGVTF